MNISIKREIELQSLEKSEEKSVNGELYNRKTINYKLSDDYHTIFESIEIEIESEIIAYFFNNYSEFKKEYQNMNSGDTVYLSLSEASDFIRYIQINFCDGLEKEIQNDIDLADNLIECHLQERNY